MRSIAGNFFFLTILCTISITPIITAIIMERKSKSGVSIAPKFDITFPAKTAIPVEIIRPIATGFMPLMTPLTNLLSAKFLSSLAIMNIMMKDGRTTPSVAHIEPIIPP